MSDLLTAVDWAAYPDALGGLVEDEAEDPLTRRARALAGTHLSAHWPRHVVLALIVQHSTERHLWSALYDTAPTLRAEERITLGRWLQNCASLLLDNAEGPPAPDPSTPPATVAQLDGLPLLDLIDNIGYQVVFDPAMTRRGACDLTTSTICLRADGEDLPYVVAHEVGHALDPLFGRPLHTDDEQYADTMAALLLRYQPHTRAQAQPLINEALGLVPADALPDLPPTTVSNLLTFLSLPLETRR